MALPRSNIVMIVLLIAGGIFLALLAGLMAATAQFFLIALFVVAVLGAVLLAQPRLLLWIVILGGVVISGVVSLYLPRFGFVKWGVPLLGMALAAIAILSAMTATHSPGKDQGQNTSGIMVWALFFFLVTTASVLINGDISFKALISLKGYFQAWGIMLAMVYIGLTPTQADRYIKALLFLGLLQVPFALHQFFFLVPERATGLAASNLVVAVDVVVGTFVGSVWGGGASAVLAALQITVIAMLLAFWRKGLVKPWLAILGSLFLIVPITLNETKVSFVFLPVALVLVFGGTFRTKPLQFFAGGVMALAVIAAIFMGYDILPRGQSAQTPDEYLEAAWRTNFGESGYGSSQLNRTTVLTHWLKSQTGDDLPYTLMGHGPGSVTSNAFDQMPPLQRRYYGLGIDLTSLSTLLWEVGVLGTIAVFGFFWSAVRTAGRLAKRADFPPVRQALLSTAQVGIALLGLSLLVNNFFNFEIGYQTLLMLLVGYVVYWQKRPQQFPLKRSPN